MENLEPWFHKYNAWSFTKHRLWNQCKLAYYFRYVGTALQESRDLNVYKLKSLKDLDSRFVLQGKLVHEILEGQIRRYQNQQKMNEQAAKTRFAQQVERYRKSAKHLIVEYHNGETVNEAFFDRIREGGFDQLSMFFGVIWPQLEDRQYVRHEKFDRFTVRGIGAIVKVDYVGKTKEDKLTICDWKTGTDDAEYEGNLQIGAYTLWATQYYQLEPERITSELIYLTTGAIHSHQFSALQLEETQDVILSDFEEMNREYGITYFVPSPEPRKCLGCHFASMCPHSMANQNLNQV